MDKLTLAFAALEVLAEESGHVELSQYLAHASHHSDVFQQEVAGHVERLKTYDKFEADHRALTAPNGRATTYSQSQLDAIIQSRVDKAVSERDKDAGSLKMTAEQLDALVAERVNQALARATQNKAGA